MRSDANLYYIYRGESTGLRGRTKTLDGKIKMQQIDKRRIKLCFENDEIKIYESIVFSKSLKRKIKLAYLELNSGGYAVLFSTDLNLDGQQYMCIIKADTKLNFYSEMQNNLQGLTQCQARNENKMHFHFNASLTAVSIAKAAYFLKNEKVHKRIIFHE